MQTLYFGGPILTMEDNRTVEALLIEDGKIKKVGLLQEIREAADSNVTEVDLKGKTLMPSFVDPHSHMYMAGWMEQLADLDGATTFEEIVDRLTHYKEENNLSDTDVIYGVRYDHNTLEEGTHPTKDVLDRVSTTNPIFISHKNVHMGVANSKAMALAGVDESWTVPEGGTIGYVEGTKEPNGYFEEDAQKTVQNALLPLLPIDPLETAKIAQELYLKNGITTAQEGMATRENIETYKQLSDNKELKIDVVAYPQVDNEAAELASEYKQYLKTYQHRFKIGGYKMFLDGSPQGKTAWLTEPYEGETEYRGYPIWKDEQVKTFIKTALNDDVQLLTHTNGDAASDQLLNNYAEALEESDNPNKEYLRPVMIHVQTAREDQLDKMSELKMLPSIFVNHVYHWGDVHLKNLGENRARRISPAKSAFEKQLVPNFHTDAPVVSPNHWESVWCGVNRITKEGKVLGPEQRVDVYDALKAVTINAAYSYFEEDIKGSLREGKLADLMIVDQNPLEIDPVKLRDIQVLETIKEGTTLYRK